MGHANLGSKLFLWKLVVDNNPGMFLKTRQTIPVLSAEATCCLSTI